MPHPLSVTGLLLLGFVATMLLLAVYGWVRNK